MPVRLSVNIFGVDNVGSQKVNQTALKVKSRPTPRAPDKCGRSAALSGFWPQTADSASGGFSSQVPPLPVTPAVETVEKGANLP
jgi:hypothetical protein